MGWGFPPYGRVYLPYGGVYPPPYGGLGVPVMFSQNVKSMKTILLVMNGVVTRDFGLLRRAIDAESLDLAI